MPSAQCIVSKTVRYAQTGNLPIDNNPVENAIRPIALGKKNRLFAGSERTGKRAAAIQSLFATAKLNDIEPFAWLKDTLDPRLDYAAHRRTSADQACCINCVI